MPTIKVPLAEPQVVDVKQNVPNITLNPGETYDMSQHIRGKSVEVLDSALSGLDESVATYSHQTKLLTAVESGSTGPLRLQVTVSESWEDYTDQPGNVKNFGALGNGVADDTVAIQAALDSGLQVFFPGGEYVVSSPLEITNPVIVYCAEESMLTGITTSSRQYFPRDGEQVRFICGNHNFANVRAPIRWYGGFLDYRDHTSGLNAIGFHFPMDWTGGHLGGYIGNVRILGNSSFIANNDFPVTFYGIYIDFENYTTPDARLENWQFVIEGRNVQEMWRVTPLNPGYGQVIRANQITSDYTRAQRAIYDEASTESEFNTIMQSINGTYTPASIPEPRNSTYVTVVLGTDNIIPDGGHHDISSPLSNESDNTVTYQTGAGNWLLQPPAGWEDLWRPDIGAVPTAQFFNTVQMIKGTVSTV